MVLGPLFDLLASHDITKGDAGAARLGRNRRRPCATYRMQPMDQGQLCPTSHSFGSMWPRFFTTLNVPPSDRAMYMFIRTWC